MANNGSISKAVSTQTANGVTPMTQASNNLASKSVSAVMSSILDSESYRKRFDELLGARSPQFIGALVSLVNASPTLQKVFYESPVTIIQSALKAATFDLPIDPNLGYAYIVPFNNKKKDAKGVDYYAHEATFIMGWKGMLQLALRTGVYKTINVVDIREGELRKYNRLTEEIDIDFMEDESERATTPVVGWCGYYQLVNGTTKTIYMTKKQIEEHEKRHRKGKYMGQGWKESFEDMASKTVYRRLIGKFGLMSIDYQKADKSIVAAADAIAKGTFDGRVDNKGNDTYVDEWTEQEQNEVMAEINDTQAVDDQVSFSAD